MNAEVTQEQKDAPVLTRYTRFVRSAKIGLGSIALLLLGLMLFYPLLRQQEPGVRISFNTTTRKAADPAIMKNPRFHGLDKDNQPYTMTAATAAEQEDERIQFDKPTGDILLKSNQRMFMSANGGIFNKKTRTLEFKSNVQLANDQGYVLRMETLHVDINTKSAVTSSEVHGQGALGTLKAYGGAMADGNNGQIIFEGPVFVTLNMSDKPKDGKQNEHK